MLLVDKEEIVLVIFMRFFIDPVSSEGDQLFLFGSIEMHNSGRAFEIHCRSCV